MVFMTVNFKNWCIFAVVFRDWYFEKRSAFLIEIAKFSNKIQAQTVHRKGELFVCVSSGVWRYLIKVSGDSLL